MDANYVKNGDVRSQLARVRILGGPWCTISTVVHLLPFRLNTVRCLSICHIGTMLLQNIHLVC